MTYAPRALTAVFPAALFLMYVARALAARCAIERCLAIPSFLFAYAFLPRGGAPSRIAAALRPTALALAFGPISPRAIAAAWGIVYLNRPFPSLREAIFHLPFLPRFPPLHIVIPPSLLVVRAPLTFHNRVYNQLCNVSTPCSPDHHTDKDRRPNLHQYSTNDALFDALALGFELQLAGINCLVGNQSPALSGAHPQRDGAFLRPVDKRPALLCSACQVKIRRRLAERCRAGREYQ
jgi:hypothetical protein